MEDQKPTPKKAIAIPTETVSTYRPVMCRLGGSDPFRLFIRPMTPDENRDLRARHMRASRKVKSLRNEMRNETVGQMERRLEAIATEKAALVLGGSEDLAVTAPAEKRAEYTAATGVSFDADGNALLPREWPESLKERVFAAYPQLVDFICSKTDEMTGVEEAEEDEETASFR